MKNVGLEKVKVMKNVVLSSDLEAGGKIRFLVKQYSMVFIGYRSATEFIEEKGMEGYRGPNSEETDSDYHKDLYLVIKDPKTSTIEWHLLKKNVTWDSCVIKSFDGKTYVVWTDREPNGLGYFIKYGRISEDLVLIEDGIVPTTRVYGFQFFVEILPDPIRLVVVYNDGIFVVNGTNITKIGRAGVLNIEKDPMNHLHVISLNAIEPHSYAIEDFDKQLNLVEHDTIKMDNSSIYATPILFLNKGVPYIYYYHCLPNSGCFVIQYFVQPIHKGTQNTTDPDNTMIANLTFVDDGTHLPYGSMPFITNYELTIYFGDYQKYPMNIRTYNVSNNFSQEPKRYFNFTIQSMYYIDKGYYVVGYENRWTYQKSFPQIMIVKIDG